MSKSHYIIPIFVPDLGCPYRCVFCNQKKITGRTVVPTRNEVRRKIISYLQTIPNDPRITREVAFYGGSFTSVDSKLQKELLTPAWQLIKSGKIDRIRVSARPDAISDETLALLSAYGVSIVELGVQSMDDEVLSLAGRGHTKKDVLMAGALIKAWDMMLGFQMMIGLPKDSREKDLSSACELISLEPDLVRIYPCLVLKDTQLADLYKRGEYIPLTLQEAVERCRELLIMFEKAGINVIRIGLQPSEQINLKGDVLAGPYHPAFRELVETAVARSQLEYLIEEKARLKTARRIEVAVPERDVSFVRGHQGSNLEYFQKNFGIKDFITSTDPALARGTIKLVAVDEKQYNYTVKRTDLPS